MLTGEREGVGEGGEPQEGGGKVELLGREEAKREEVLDPRLLRDPRAVFLCEEGKEKYMLRKNSKKKKKKKKKKSQTRSKLMVSSMKTFSFFRSPCALHTTPI